MHSIFPIKSCFTYADYKTLPSESFSPHQSHNPKVVMKLKLLPSPHKRCPPNPPPTGSPRHSPPPPCPRLPPQRTTRSHAHAAVPPAPPAVAVAVAGVRLVLKPLPPQSQGSQHHNVTASRCWPSLLLIHHEFVGKSYISSPCLFERY